MRNLLIFMLLVAIFVFGRQSSFHGFHFSLFGVKGTGPVQTETRSVRDFHAIESEISADVEVTVGDHFSVEISAQQNLLPLIKTTLENGALHITSEDNFNTSEEIKIRVTAPAFDRFSLGGSGTLRVMSSLQAANMDMAIAGSGDIFCMQGDFGTLKTSIAGSGTVELGGKANDLSSDISGSGDVKAKSLTTNTLNASISGSGTVTADVTRELKAAISGSGDVFYSGTPSVDSNISGSGSVQKIAVQ